MVRSKVAFSRERENGLFVSKEKEIQLKRKGPNKRRALLNESDSETDDPD